MNSLVTSLHISVSTIPILVVIHQLWLRKIPPELSREAQIAEFIVQIGIFQRRFLP